MSTILRAAAQSSRLMARFSQLLAQANLKGAKTLPLMAATSLIAGTDNTSSGELLAPSFEAVRTCLRARLSALEVIARAKQRTSR